MKVARTVLRRVGAGNCSRLSDKHEPNTITGSTENAYQYNGKELNSDFGLDWLDYGARWYDASIARWSAVDPLAEKYYPISPYVYVANNPLKYIDPDGKQIDVGDINKTKKAKVETENGEKEIEVNAATKLVEDLKNLTGLDLYIKKGKIKYNKKFGVFAKVKKVDGKKVGSKTARKQVKKLINSLRTVKVLDNQGNGSKGGVSGKNNIDFDINQVESFMANTSKDLADNTMGYGLTFIHESGHTRVGRIHGDKDYIYDMYHNKKPYESPGPIEDFLVNQIRSELGSEYGQRMIYEPLKASDGKYYVPFSQESLERLQSGQISNEKAVMVSNSSFNK